MDTEIIDDPLSTTNNIKQFNEPTCKKPINNILKQKDNLISYLKDTVNNLSNIIVGNANKIENLNHILNDYITDSEEHNEQLFKYDSEILLLKKGLDKKTTIINELTNKLEELNDAYDKINHNYIHNIKRHIESKTQYLNTVDTLKYVNETIKQNYKYRLWKANCITKQQEVTSGPDNQILSLDLESNLDTLSALSQSNNPSDNSINNIIGKPNE